MQHQTAEYLLSQLNSCHKFWLRQYRRIGTCLALPITEQQAVILTASDCHCAYIDKTIRGDHLSFNDVNKLFHETFGIDIPDRDDPSLQNLLLSIVPNGENDCEPHKVNQSYYTYPEDSDLQIFNRYIKQKLTPPQFYIPENMPPIKETRRILKGRHIIYRSDGYKTSAISDIIKEKAHSEYSIFLEDGGSLYTSDSVILTLLNQCFSKSKIFTKFLDPSGSVQVTEYPEVFNLDGTQLFSVANP